MNPYISPADPRRQPWTLDSARLQMPAAPPMAKASANPVSGAGDLALAGGVTTLNPYIAGAGLGLKAVGTGMEIAGAFGAQDEADRNYALARDAYIAQTVQAQEEARRRQRQEAQANAGLLSAEAVAAGQRDYAAMAPYNRAIGR